MELLTVMKNYNKVFGNKILVEKEFKTTVGIKQTEEFTNIVKVLAVGNTFEFKDSVKEGDRLLVSGVQEVFGEFYVIPLQIYRNVLS